MAITFPTDPGAQSPANTFSPSSTPVANSANGNTYVWNGTAWTTQQANLEQYVNVAGDTMTGPLTGTSATYSGNIAAANIPTQGSIVGYQQGIWTPTLSFGTANATNSTWFRIGNAVTVYTTLSTFSDSSTAQALRVLSLPYINADAQVMGSAMYRYVNVEGYTTAFVSNEGIYLYGGIAGNWASLFYTNLNSSGSTDMYLSGTYTTDDTTWTPINGAAVS